MEIKGIITAVLAPREGDSANGHWKTQEFVVEHGSISFPRKAVFSMRNSKLDDFWKLISMGKRVTVSFDIDAHEYQGRWYNSVNAYKVEELGQQQAPAAEAAPFPPAVNGEGLI